MIAYISLMIYIDIDNTLNTLSSSYLKSLNKITGYGLISNRELQTEYTIYKNFNFNNEHGMILENRIFSTPGFFENIPICDGAFDAVKYLNSKYDVYIVSTPFTPYKDCCKEKYNWVEKNLPFFDLNKIIFINQKYLLYGNENDVLIDDIIEILLHLDDSKNGKRFHI